MIRAATLRAGSPASITVEYTSTQIAVHRQFVIPAEAGIQAVFLDSGQKIAEMTL
jgi:hypothetical protein